MKKVWNELNDFAKITIVGSIVVLFIGINFLMMKEEEEENFIEEIDYEEIIP